MAITLGRNFNNWTQDSNKLKFFWLMIHFHILF